MARRYPYTQPPAPVQRLDNDHGHEHAARVNGRPGQPPLAYGPVFAQAREAPVYDRYIYARDEAGLALPRQSYDSPTTSHHHHHHSSHRHGSAGHDGQVAALAVAAGTTLAGMLLILVIVAVIVLRVQKTRTGYLSFRFTDDASPSDRADDEEWGAAGDVAGGRPFSSTLPAPPAPPKSPRIAASVRHARNRQLYDADSHRRLQRLPRVSAPPAAAPELYPPYGAGGGWGDEEEGERVQESQWSRYYDDPGTVGLLRDDELGMKPWEDCPRTPY